MYSPRKIAEIVEALFRYRCRDFDPKDLREARIQAVIATRKSAGKEEMLDALVKAIEPFDKSKKESEK